MFTDAKTQANDYIDFLSNSPSSYHAATLVANRLMANGYHNVKPYEVWPKDCGKYVVVKNGAVIAWSIPAGVTAESFTFKIVGAHTDSPAFKLKPRPGSTKTGDGWNQLEVEVYGGMLANSWLDRDLGLAGRVIDESGKNHLVKTDAIARIPQLAIHLDRQVDREGLKLDAQQHLHPIWGFGSDVDIYDYLAQQAGVNEIYGADIFTFDTAKPNLIGLEKNFVAAGRQDNLSSVHAALVALEDAGDEAISIFAAFDHEEVGSGSEGGARGSLLEDVMRHCGYVLDANEAQYRAALGLSVCISADAGHLVHPNYAERHDPHHHPIPGGGPLLKINADQRYATDARGSAYWHSLCKTAGIDYQNFVSNNSMPCGSTIGPFTAMRLGILTIDVGIGLLSMHSVRELSQIDDSFSLSKVLRTFWQ